MILDLETAFDKLELMERKQQWLMEDLIRLQNQFIQKLEQSVDLSIEIMRKREEYMRAIN